MKHAIKLLTFLNVAFIVFLMLSSSFTGWIRELLYYLAFIVPIVIGCLSSEELKRKREEVAGVREEPDRLLEFDLGRAKRLLPLIAPTVAIVFVASFMTSLILSLIGASSSGVEEAGIVRMILVHALAPALFEEALFRYIPLKLIMPYSKRWCVFYSALCFALIHCNFAQMPYAFLAGVMFMIIDVAFGSIWPSIILHFVNNAASVVWIKYGDGAFGVGMFVGVLLGLVIVSIPFIYTKKDAYRCLLRGSLDKGENMVYTPAFLSLVLICGYVAVTRLYA